MRSISTALALALTLCLCGCYYGPPNMASVVKRRGATPRLFSQAEIQVDSASSYLTRREGSGEPVRVHYRSVAESFAGGVVDDYFFAVIYFSGHTAFFPGVGLGLIYDRIYAGAFASTAIIRDEEHPWSLQAGYRFADWFTLVVDSYPIVHSEGFGYDFLEDTDTVRRVYRILPTFTFRNNAIELAPYAFHGGRDGITGYGASVAVSLSGIFN